MERIPLTSPDSALVEASHVRLKHAKELLDVDPSQFMYSGEVSQRKDLYRCNTRAWQKKRKSCELASLQSEGWTAGKPGLFSLSRSPALSPPKSLDRPTDRPTDKTNIISLFIIQSNLHVFFFPLSELERERGAPWLPDCMRMYVREPRWAVRR